MKFKLPQYAYLLGNRGILKDHMRRLLVEQHEVDRTVYKAMTTDKTLPLDIRLQVQRLFETEVPRDSAASRVVNRCVLTGRAHGVHRFARLSRIMIRQLAHQGFLPGVSKASW
ncbi:Ribosomal protein S14, mitochondrial [Tetrabaena socialis]|uniref:Ribosomal protein S14, mitochondrial n=1 Tax=Tetrabaena socialis TaxID=47790 RepID=A0A2J8AFX0_9CHLO|nr:Ribosomal protein S14, mitochondrial [Tetrabaena socialis]|eukprot:PNH11392.1 Ribosomal protein S14, mitochondrial [Tetrabaena socialis]